MPSACCLCSMHVCCNKNEALSINLKSTPPPPPPPVKRKVGRKREDDARKVKFNTMNLNFLK